MCPVKSLTRKEKEILQIHREGWARFYDKLQKQLQMEKEAHFFNTLRKNKLNTNRMQVLFAVAAGHFTSHHLLQEFDMTPQDSNHIFKSLVRLGYLKKKPWTPPPGQYKRINAYEVTPKGLLLLSQIKTKMRGLYVDTPSKS